MSSNFKPFEKIGLCFSGGGYRATFFSLGATSYLNQIKYKEDSLLKNVTALSTVSGGTLLGVALAKAIADSKFNYDSFYESMYSSFLPENDKLLENSVAKLGKDGVWKENDYKKRSLINAFALEYNEMDLFSGSFALLKNLENENPNGYKLRDVCFNATEFSFGLPFRFQNTGDFSNRALFCKELSSLVNDIQLADIVASSSCFPLGFEPLTFPQDYFKNKGNEKYNELFKKSVFASGVGIMDGGISDNQGIESMLNTHKRDSLDLIIVNDVASYKMTPWEKGSEPISNQTTFNDYVTKIISQFNIKWIYPLLMILGAGILVGNNLIDYDNSTPTWPNILGAVILGIGLTLTILGFLAFKIKNKVLKWFNSVFKKTIPPILIDEVTSFQNLSIDLVKRLLKERITSSVKMLNDVLLNQIRRLNYDTLFKNDSFQFNRIGSTVDRLDGKDTIYAKFKINDRVTVQPSEKLTKTVRIAAETPTSLWWDEEDIKLDRMDNLISCGQLTTCYGLLDYIIDLPEEYTSEPDIIALKTQLEDDWKKFNDNPMFMVKP